LYFFNIDDFHNPFSQSKAGRDQLLARLKTAKEDSNKVNILIAIGKSYEEENKTTAEKYYLLAGTLGKKLDIPTDARFLRILS
jgi:hypothetical protein